MPTDEDTITGIIREYVSFINQRDFAKLRSASYFGPTSSSSFEYHSSGGDSLENHVKAFEEHCKIYPDRRVQTLDIDVTLEGKQRASAILNTVMADGSGIEIPGATLVTFRKIDGEWKVMDVSSMRGPGSVSLLQSSESQEDKSTAYLRTTFSSAGPKKPVTITFEEDGPEAIKAMLMSHARQFIELHNNATDIMSLLSAPWIAPYFLAGTANRTSADINLQTYVQRQVQYLQTFPQFHTRVTNVQAELDPSFKTATVYVDTEHAGAPPGMKIPGIGILSWRADELSGKWIFWKLVVMRGNIGSET